MLAMRSYEQNEGFSVMTADELFYVNGGSGSSGGTTPDAPVRYVIAAVVATITGMDMPASQVQAATQGLYEAMGGGYK